jgi:hypothetical protein
MSRMHEEIEAEVCLISSLSTGGHLNRHLVFFWQGTTRVPCQRFSVSQGDRKDQLRLPPEYMKGCGCLSKRTF